MFNRCISNSFFVSAMEKKILTVDEAINNLGKLYDVLKSGGIIGVPTDTIYGIACLACNTDSLKKIYSIKERDNNKPLAICVSSTNDLQKWSNVTINDKSLTKLLPGPVTLVFNRRTTLPAELNPNNPSIGIRIPNYKLMVELAKYCNEPLALTSANISNQPSSLNIKEFEALWNDLDIIVDGGELGVSQMQRAGSTVIDLTLPGTFKIIREGTHYDSVLKILEKECKLIKRSV